MILIDLNTDTSAEKELGGQLIGRNQKIA